MSKKKRILEAATALFARKGFKETSVAELSEASGVATGTILYHFKSKEGLFVAVLDHLQAALLPRFRQLFSEADPASGLGLIEAVMSAYLKLAGEMEEHFLMLHRHDPYRMARDNPVCRRHLEALYDGLVDLFEQAVFAGQRDGSIRGVPTRKAALILFSMADGIARLNTYQLYDGGALHDELLCACRRMLAA